MQKKKKKCLHQTGRIISDGTNNLQLIWAFNPIFLPTTRPRLLETCATRHWRVTIDFRTNVSLPIQVDNILIYVSLFLTKDVNLNSRRRIWRHCRERYPDFRICSSLQFVQTYRQLGRRLASRKLYMRETLCRNHK